MAMHKEYFTHHGQEHHLPSALKDSLDGSTRYIMECMTNQTVVLNNIVHWF